MSAAIQAPQQVAQKPRRKKKLLIALGILSLIAILIIGISWWLNRPIKPVILAAEEQQQLEMKVIAMQQERSYEKGTNIIQLTEREINALFHKNTQLGDQIRFELASDAVHARVSTDLNSDLPLVGGKKLKARARFIITDENNAPAIILDDLTVWGVSIPNAWLAEMKGQNLLNKLGIDPTRSQLSKGIKTVKITNGNLRIELAE